MIEIKNVIGSDAMVNYGLSERYIDINVDTVYIRTNIKKSEENDKLYIYDELQLTIDEYENYKTTLLLNDMEDLKKYKEKIAKLQEENELLKGCIMELASIVFA
ncbi:hypothetical protein KQI61_07975 [Anaerocolumna aminovalerica]|uniref:hypothetical protein n=1 Tax=Anaerocolumna aminovalerica TaxID=1527 RepID=UPI001C0F3B47|nr:hypothetical protein [Anaerocolumna aminovalerica]MBU5332134.1 hypothetical protein [Anaerocolumna aminovalerica]